MKGTAEERNAFARLSQFTLKVTTFHALMLFLEGPAKAARRVAGIRLSALAMLGWPYT
jgi:hypothetical protein